MDSFFDKVADSESKKKSDLFTNKIDSQMHFTSGIFGDSLSFDWVDEIDLVCPYIDNVVRRPKLALIKEENTVKIEKSKKITVESIKDLSKHTNYISKIDKITNDVQPSKILDIRNEETFNTYENRFLYTLLYHLNRFIIKKEELLNNFEISDNKVLEYTGSSMTDTERLNIELKVTSNDLPKEKRDKDMEKKIEDVKVRLKRIREYLTSWQRSEMMKALDKAHVSFITPPIKKTNIFLKNPNFQMALRLWGMLQSYGAIEDDNTKDSLDTAGDNNLKSFLDNTFLINYFVLDSISSSKKEQKDKLAKYALYILTEEIHRTLTLLLNNGIKVTDEELLSLIAKEIKNEKNNRLVGIDDVKKKFKSAMDEYLERTQNYL